MYGSETWTMKTADATGPEAFEMWVWRRLVKVKYRGGSSRRAAGLKPSLKNVRQKIPPNGQTRLKFGFRYENFTTQSFSVLPTISAQRFLGIQ